jgi:hypothetical protein
VKIAMLAALAVIGATAPAAAQFYPYPPPQREYYQPAPQPYYSPRQGYGYGYGGGGYYQRPVVIGDICQTSRGDCRTRPAQEGANCRCNIPGFGPKRGNIIAGRGW